MLRVPLFRSMLASAMLVAGALGVGDAQPSAPDESPADAGPPDATATSDPVPEAPAFDAQLSAILRSRSGEITLVGRSGQLYEPAGARTWVREESGGVSASVLAMYRSGSGKLYAVGTRAPMFTRDTGLWTAYPLARKGSATANTGSAPIIALKRQLYELGANGWRAVARAPSSVKHLWAASSTRTLLTDHSGQLWSGRGKGWQRIRITLRPDEQIASLHGVAGTLAVALTSHGRVFSIEKRAARPISAGTLGSDLRVQVLGAVGGVLMAAAEAGQQNVLLKVGPRSMEHAGDLWPLSDGDRFSIVAEHPEGLLVASERGQVRISPGNNTWHNAVLEAKPDQAPVGFPNSGPARAR